MKLFNGRIWFNYISYSIIQLLSNSCYIAMTYSFSFIIEGVQEYDTSKFLISSIASCAFIIAHLLFEYFSQLILNQSIKLINTKLRVITAKNFFTENYKVSLDTGEFININSTKINQLADNYFTSIFDISRCIIAIIISYGFLLYISWIAMLAVMILSLLVLVIPMLMSKIGQKRINVANEENDKFLQTTKDTYNSYWVYWSMNQTNKLINQIVEGSKKLEVKNQKMKNVISTTRFLDEIVVFLGQVILIIFFCWMYWAGYIMNIGLIFTLNILSSVYCFFSSSSAKALMNIINHRKVYLSNYKQDNKINNNTVIGEDLKTIEFKNVDFKYKNSSNLIIEKFNLKINKGDKVLIKGKSGIGKTTLLKTLFNPSFRSNGQVYVNEQEVEAYDIRSLCSYISQDIVFSKGKLIDMLKIANESAEEKQVLSLFELLGLNQLLEKLPEGLNTKIDDNSSNFSGGEKQRFSIIRGLLENKSWYFLDEIISALDESSSNKVLDLFLLDNKKTVILVTHKIDDKYLSHFDKIINL
ncbi:hypothetical protein SHELI_v1c00870 [Spiroplasma helicoides]|uniref:ABC transporter ATP-binding protein n=1 Tax=Spiroplasma helicoides TaxID=216938 RepID=A0A1B3SJE2_9MOLU|nr:ATP-binding cassette domain-containing protein [Spiroplasma helicoides]AOG60042.1 hypothetical protein SHELI_v1c00870 [Spiroplasma helicoides]